MNVPFRKDYPPKNDIVFSIMFENIGLFAGATLKISEQRSILT